MSLSLVSVVLSGRGLCLGLITRPEESCRVRCVLTECDHESSIMRRAWPAGGCCSVVKKFKLIINLILHCNE